MADIDDASYPLIGFDGELHVLEHSSEKLYTHSASQCKGNRCTIHNRSDHRMRSFPQHWRSDRQIMERICPHGIGHPDPDEYRVLTGADRGVHGCDGCCGPTQGKA